MHTSSTRILVVRVRFVIMRAIGKKITHVTCTWPIITC